MGEAESKLRFGTLAGQLALKTPSLAVGGTDAHSCWLGAIVRSFTRGELGEGMRSVWGEGNTTGFGEGGGGTRSKDSST